MTGQIFLSRELPEDSRSDLHPWDRDSKIVEGPLSKIILYTGY